MMQNIISFIKHDTTKYLHVLFSKFSRTPLSLLDEILLPKYFWYFSVFLSVSIYSINSSWTFNRYGSLDHFAYLGAALYFPDINKQFPHSTIIELLPTYIPGVIFYKLLSPQLANFARDIFFLTITLKMLMSIAYFLTQDTIITCLVTLAIGSYNYFLVSIGSDYTDSTIQILCIAHLYVISRICDQKDSSRVPGKAFFYLGILSALMFSSGVLSIVYVANYFLYILLIFYFGEDEYRPNISEFFKLLTMYVFGNLLVIICISIYLGLIGHNYYMKLNLLKLFGYLGGVFQNPPLLDWLPDSGWLVLPFSVFIISAIHVIYYFKTIILQHGENISENDYTKTWAQDNKVLLSRKLVFLLFLISTSISMIFIQFFIKQWSLQFYYFSQINFIYYLGMGVLISLNFYSIPQNSKMIILVSAVILAFWSLHLTTHHVIAFEDIIQLFPFPKGSLMPWIFFIATFTLIIYLHLKRIIFPIIMIVSIFAIDLVSYSQNFGGFCCIDALPLKFFGSIGTTSQNIFDDTIRLSYIINKLDKNRNYDVWFDDKELLGQVYRQVFSMNYFNSPDNMINKSLPFLGDYSGPRGSSGHHPLVSRKIILISDNSQKIQEAVKNLELLFDEKVLFNFEKVKIGNVEIYIYVTT